MSSSETLKKVFLLEENIKYDAMLRVCKQIMRIDRLYLVSVLRSLPRIHDTGIHRIKAPMKNGRP